MSGGDGRRMTHKEAFLSVTSTYNNHMAMLSMAAYLQFCDLTDAMEPTRYYRATAKHFLKRCRRWYDTYWRRVGAAYGDKYPLYADYANQCVRQVEHDVMIFYYSIKSALDKLRVRDSALKARVLLTGELIRVSADFHRDFWAIACEHTGYADLGDPFRYADPSPLMSLFDSLTSAVCSREEQAVLDYDRNSRIALRAVLSKCENSDNLGAAAREAVLLNCPQHPEYADIVREYDDRMDQTARAEEERMEAEARRAEDAARDRIASKLSTKYKVRHERERINTVR